MKWDTIAILLVKLALLAAETVTISQENLVKMEVLYQEMVAHRVVKLNLVINASTMEWGKTLALPFAEMD